MNRKQYSQIVILALIAGLVGGVVSNQFLMGEPYLAEKNGLQEKVIRAERFELVDNNGTLRGILGIIGYDPSLMLVDKDGCFRCVLTAAPDGASLFLRGKDCKDQITLSGRIDPALRFYDEKGNVVWKAP
jgi:hypothetical protein